MVVNAVFSGVEHDDKLGHEWEKVHGHAKSTRSFFGFKRDQPAVWHVLSNTWAEDAEVPYLGQSCEVWHNACNPDENPIECWHWCHWSALQRAKYRVATHASGTDGSQGASPWWQLERTAVNKPANASPPRAAGRCCTRRCKHIRPR